MKTSLLVLCAAVSAVLLAALGCNSQHGDDFGPTPTPSGTPVLPSMATFGAKVQPFFDGNSCAVTGTCHDATTTGGGFKITIGNTAATFTVTACDPRLTAFGASPAGHLLNHFCTGSGTPSVAHNGHAASAQNCTDFYAWAAEGSGAPPTCP